MKLWVKQRVRLRKGVDGPPCRVGTVISVERGGALVKHDQATDMGDIFGLWENFGWMASELEPLLQEVPRGPTQT